MYNCVSIQDWGGMVRKYYEDQGGFVSWLKHIHLDFSVDPNR